MWEEPERLPVLKEDDGLVRAGPKPISEYTRQLAESVGIEVVNHEDFLRRSEVQEEINDDREERDEEMIHGNEPIDMEVGAMQSTERPISAVTAAESRDEEIFLMISMVGGDGKSFRREAKQSVKRLVSEIYSPPRATKMLEKLPSQEVAPGFALDLTTVDENGEPWDFCRKDMTEKARKLLIKTEPILLVGSPECKAFSSWQTLNNLKRGD